MACYKQTISHTQKNTNNNNQIRLSFPRFVHLISTKKAAKLSELD